MEIMTLSPAFLVLFLEEGVSPPTWAAWTTFLTVWTTSASPESTSLFSSSSSLFSSSDSAASVFAVEAAPSASASSLSAAAAVGGIPRRKRLPTAKGKNILDLEIIWRFVNLFHSGILPWPPTAPMSSQLQLLQWPLRPTPTRLQIPPWAPSQLQLKLCLYV